MEILVLIVMIICFLWSVVGLFGELTGTDTQIGIARVISLVGAILPIVYILKITAVI